MEQRVTSPPTESTALPRNKLPDSPAIESLIDRTALGDRVPFMLRSREMAAFVATSSPEEQEASEVRMARQQEALRLREMRKARQIAESSSATATTIRPVGLTLLDLPPEILTHILFYLPFTSVVICQGINRHLHVLISQSTELQYYVHLGISGLVDNPHCTLGISERLSLLLERERRWDGFDCDYDKIIELPVRLQRYMGTLSAGVFGGLAMKQCYYVRIPSTPTEEVKWREIRTEQNIIIDVPCFQEPNLHILVTAQPRTAYTTAAKPYTVHDIQVHLNQLSTGGPHPDVRRATISFETCEEFEEPRVFVKCAGDNMVLILQDREERNKPDDQVLVYDWRTGELKLSFSAPWDSYYHPLFLTTHLLLLPNAATGELEYWRIPRSPSEPTPNHPLFLLSLPRLRSGNTFQMITCIAEPNAGPRNVSKPFYTNLQDAIVVFCVHILSAGRSTSFRLFVHRSSLVECLDRLSAFLSFDKRPEPVPYDHWGPYVCRWFNYVTEAWLEATFGQKYIAPPPPGETEGAPLTLLNFNPIDVARVLLAENHLKATEFNEGGQSPTQIEEDYREEGGLSGDNTDMGPEYERKEVMESYNSPHELRPRPRAVIRPMDPLNDPEDLFEHTVYSSLPYTVRSSQDKYRDDLLLLDEESILGIQIDDEENVKEIHVLHYG